MKTRKIFFSLCVLSSLSWGYSDTVYNVQEQLSELGYSAGTSDGKLGRGTAKAIRQYQEDNGLRVNGRVTNELLGNLGIGRESKIEKAPATSHKESSNYTNNNSISSNGNSFLDGISSGNLTKNFKDGKYKIGFLTSWPSYGISLKVDYSDKITLEAIAAPMGTFSTYSAKVNYNLTNNQNYKTYAYASGGVGMYEYTTYSSSGWSAKAESDTETVPMFGAGVGLEWSWRKFLGQDFPDLYSTIEFGYANMSFDYYDFGGFMYGGGIYYKF